MGYVNSTKVIFGDISRTEVFSEMSALRLTSIDVLSEHNKMADSVEISFVDKNDFVKEGKWYFLSDNSQWKMRTSGETDVHFRLKLKIT